MPNCKSFLVTEAERKHIRPRARFQQHEYANCLQVFSSLKGKALKEIHAILIEIIRENSTSNVTIKNWVVQFKRDVFST